VLLAETLTDSYLTNVSVTSASCGSLKSDNSKPSGDSKLDEIAPAISEQPDEREARTASLAQARAKAARRITIEEVRIDEKVPLRKQDYQRALHNYQLIRNYAGEFERSDLKGYGRLPRIEKLLSLGANGMDPEDAELLLGSALSSRTINEYHDYIRKLASRKIQIKESEK
jgi:hypothetical protein